MRRSRSPHVSHVTRADDEGNGPPEVMCHMWMRERPPPLNANLVCFPGAPQSTDALEEAPSPSGAVLPA